MVKKKGSYGLSQPWTTSSLGEDNVKTQSSNGHASLNDERRDTSSLPGPGRGEEEEYERGQWTNRTEFILSCIGLSVGLGNIWRFPYLALKHGGAAFLIAYIILQLLIGKPMYLMELVMGQFSARGPTTVWAMNPAGRGIGIAMLIISLNVSIYYNVIMAYTLYYLFSSMQAVLPWTVCKPEWTDCVEKRIPYMPMCTGNETMDSSSLCRCLANFTEDYIQATNCSNTTTVANPRTASEYFFYSDVIQRSPGIEPENMGIPIWRLTLCLVLAWIVVGACLIKGVKSSGKVVYFSATFPYIILLILLIKGATLDGAIDGVIFFIVPKWQKLLDLEVWVAAAGQMFFSLGVSFGGIIMFGSYNHFKNNVYFDSLLISGMDLITSVVAGFVIFTSIGSMARQVGGNTTVDNIVTQPGYGLAFVAYPEALANLPVPQLWSVLFFFMLFTLGLDSEFGMLETLLTCAQDEFPFLRNHKSKVCIVISIACFLMGLPCVCPGGDYVVTLMDHYGADFAVLCVATVETIAVMWVYGVMRFLKDVEFMLGYKPTGWPYWVFCWCFVSPILISLLFIYRMVTYKGPTYSKERSFPPFAVIVGWVILGITLCPIPIVFVYKFVFRASGNVLQRLKQICRPTEDWGPSTFKEEYQKMRTKQIPMTYLDGYRNEGYAGNNL